MRVLFLTHAYPPHALGGLTLRCQEVLDGLRDRGHITHVLTSRYGLADRVISEKDITRSLHFEAAMDHYRPFDFFYARSRREEDNLCELRSAIDAFHPDILFIWGLWNLSRTLPYWAERWMSPGRVAYAIADYWPIEPDMHQAYWRLPARRRVVESLKALARPTILRRLEQQRAAHSLQFQHVTCCSEYTANKLVAASALPHGARVIHNGIDPEPFLGASRSASGGRGLRMLYFGGLSEYKGVHTAIEALGLLREKGHTNGLTLSLVGSGHPDYVSQLHQVAAQLDVSEQVIFHGAVPRTEIPALLGSYDVFLFTSLWEEPFGRTIIEAMAAGLAVIGSYVGGSREIMMDGENALTFAPGDAAALAERIVQITASPNLRDRLAQAGRRTVLERFTLDRMVDEVEEWLQSIVKDSKVA